MLPVCSATTHSQGSIYGGIRSLSPCLKTFEVKCNMMDLSNKLHLQEISLKTQSFSSDFIENTGRYNSVDINRFSNQNETNYIKDKLVNSFYYPINFENEEPGFVESNNNSLTINTNSLSNVKTDTLAEIVKTFNETIKNGENAVNASLDKLVSSVTSALDNYKEAVNNSLSKVMSSADKSGDIADNKLTGLSSGLKEASGKIGVIVIDVLRNTILVVEDSLTKGGKFLVYGYGSVKNLLPLEIRDVINLSEEKANIVLRPLGTAFQQAYVALEALERGLGIDPNDPIVTVVLFVGASATLWVSYRVLTYGGYSGDLSPKSTMELLSGKETAVLIDIRPEDLRERDGIPDLRRNVRSRYANVTLPEVDRSIRKLLKGGKDLDGTLIAGVIRNLKIVQDRSKVIVMDADGTQSKGIARSLKKLGIKTPYLVQGGFQSWVNEGLRIKELKPETTFTILNEDAEAILEEFNPTPLKLLAYGSGFIATVYAGLEWEKTLQYIGVIGVGLTIFQRFTSYGGSEDLKQDLRLLLVPVSWATAKLETGRNGLPTSPSSLDVQNRVLQAAAKHESQPLDDEQVQDFSTDQSQPSINENIDLSEA